MSVAEPIEPTEAPVIAPRRPGRPPRNVEAASSESKEPKAPKPAKAEKPVEMWYGLPCMPDAEMEQYGGDLAALDSWSPKAGRPLATWRNASLSSSSIPELLSKGMLVYRHAPEQLFHFAFLLEDGQAAYQQAFYAMQKRGYRPATLADWYVHSILRGVLLPEDGTLRLTLGGAIKGGATVVYYQDEANYRRIRKLERTMSNEIQKTAMQKAAEQQERANREGLDGITIETEFENG